MYNFYFPLIEIAIKTLKMLVVKNISTSQGETILKVSNNALE